MRKTKGKKNKSWKVQNLRRLRLAEWCWLTGLAAGRLLPQADWEHLHWSDHQQAIITKGEDLDLQVWSKQIIQEESGVHSEIFPHLIMIDTILTRSSSACHVGPLALKRLINFASIIWVYPFKHIWTHLKQFWKKFNPFDNIWTSFEQVWTCLNIFEHIWTYLNTFEQIFNRFEHI